ncbi:hypothetical protein FDP41_006729 [Naegleria fowleri]|uniref:Uncharacterized protein n=1 Tax=Naegleria fowleri TaxID=5763 RepID=A0A6A5BMI7_NAEFO|nr:uncharacterized protein FDP41_006729 [Naegleria fowleri]KAF0974119.1 hypothetical protein FDP41_006729 [Naegleria fowleri]
MFSRRAVAVVVVRRNITVLSSSIRCSTSTTTTTTTTWVNSNYRKDSSSITSSTNKIHYHSSSFQSSSSSPPPSTINILYFAMRFPELSATASSVRIYQLLESFKQLPYYLNHTTRDLIHEFNHKRMNHSCHSDMKSETNSCHFNDDHVNNKNPIELNNTTTTNTTATTNTTTNTNNNNHNNNSIATITTTSNTTTLNVTFITPQSIHSLHAQQFYNDFKDQFTSFQLKTIESNDLTSMDEFLKEYSSILPHKSTLNLCIFDTMISEEIYSFRVREVLEGSFYHHHNYNHHNNYSNHHHDHHHSTTLFITDTQDLRSVRNFRMEQLNQQQQQHDASFFVSMDLPNATNELLLRELSSIYRSDLSLIVSRDELNYLIHFYGIPKQKLGMASFFYSFNQKQMTSSSPEEMSSTSHPSYSSSSFTSSSHSSSFTSSSQYSSSFHSRHHFMTIGNGHHPPNKDSIYYMRHYVWPFIHSKLPNAEFHIYGAYLSNQSQLSSKSLNFYVKGKMKDLNEMSKYRVNLAMLRAGAGIKGKIADGWMYGLPCVSTLIGYEGMNLESGICGDKGGGGGGVYGCSSGDKGGGDNDKGGGDNDKGGGDRTDSSTTTHTPPSSFLWGGLIAHSMDEFVSHAHSLYTNEELWIQTSRQGFHLLSQLFSQELNTHHLLLDIKRVYELKILNKKNSYNSSSSSCSSCSGNNSSSNGTYSNGCDVNGHFNTVLPLAKMRGDHSYYSAPYNYVQHILALNQYRTSHYMAKYIHEKNKKKNDE